MSEFLIGLSLGIGLMAFLVRHVLKSGLVISFVDGHVVIETERQISKRLIGPMDDSA